jgi:hypothetical protein
MAGSQDPAVLFGDDDPPALANCTTQAHSVRCGNGSGAEYHTMTAGRQHER